MSDNIDQKIPRGSLKSVTIQPIKGQTVIDTNCPRTTYFRVGLAKVDDFVEFRCLLSQFMKIIIQSNGHQHIYLIIITDNSISSAQLI